MILPPRVFRESHITVCESTTFVTEVKRPGFSVLYEDRVVKFWQKVCLCMCISVYTGLSRPVSVPCSICHEQPQPREGYYSEFRFVRACRFTNPSVLVLYWYWYFCTFCTGTGDTSPDAPTPSLHRPTGRQPGRQPVSV